MNTTDTLRRFVIGSDPLINMFTATVGQDNYPPYNLTQESEDRFTIEIAVAGFSQDDIEVSQTKNILSIRTTLEGETRRLLSVNPVPTSAWNNPVIGRTTSIMQSTSAVPVEFPVKVHQGLAKRSFNRQWALADGWKARGASMKLGVLTVAVEYEKPKDSDTIPIQINNTDERQALKG